MEQTIRRMACSLGFAACGIAKAAPVDAQTADSYRKWIAEGRHADMDYLARNVDKRLDPTLLVPGCRSIIVVALNYYPAQRILADEYQVAYYAYGRDYHEVIREKLALLLSQLNVLRGIEDTRSSNLQHAQRIFVDTAPILERYWAQQASIGWIGRNRQLIIPHAGSYHLLGILTTDLDLQPDSPCPNRCGTCHRCLDACPSHALSPDAPLDARRCISYHTIEQKTPFSSDDSACFGHRIYGCDTCQTVCPWNRFATPTEEPNFQPNPQLLSMKRTDWQHLTKEQYDALFQGSAVQRAGYENLCRNIAAVSDNDK